MNWSYTHTHSLYKIDWVYKLIIFRIKTIYKYKLKKISPILTTQNSNKVKNIARTALPVTSTLGVLAGSSMGPIIPRDNITSHVPGTSVDDSLGEVLSHTGEQLIDLGTSAADAIGQGISNAADGIAGLVDHILDSLG